ncbi:MAG TPA: PadR family transcriptional regulator [Segeticoccus sp.]|uniref:PadR family transcriptional regulator n=1 Tax=Segeticoccus sp. TaxID=2706531 RepID=UPI002D7F37A4|nr:PadR family transcriptional regulator [Segeticoccus sp.]HET8601765.1 PadR family transcriptional regulator [Segeticoccus sp.]
MAVFAHGQLRLYLLALLNDGPRHGYEVIRALEERFNGLYSPSAGTVYPRLAKLEEEGLVERADEGRKVTYRITDAGRQEVRERQLDLIDLQQDLDHTVRQLAAEVRQRVHGSATDLRAELKQAAKEARRTATPAGTQHGAQWGPFGGYARTSSSSGTAGSARGGSMHDVEAAINAFRYDVRDAVRRLQSDEETRREVITILSDTARRIRDVLQKP